MDAPERAHTLRSIEPPDRDALVGRVIDERYRIVGRLGAGGMGIVYRGTHEVLGSPLAVKVLHPAAATDEEAIERFRREAQAASAIGSEHIVEARDFGRLEDGSTYIVMELIEGRDLFTVVQESPLPWARVRGIALQLCEALGAAHERGIVHRDLKLENVLLTARRGQVDFVKLLDFGIAKIQGSAKLTVAGRVMGTPEYMSPEQCAARPVDHRTDIYAFGVMLYEMMTAQLPFTHPELGPLFRMHIHEPPPPPSSARPDLEIPAGVEAVILRCLAKNPAARFQSMDEVATALRAVEGGAAEVFVDTSELDMGASGAVPVAGPQSGEAVTRPRAPRRALWAVPVLLGAVLAVGGGAWAWARQASEEARVTPLEERSAVVTEPVVDPAVLEPEEQGVEPPSALVDVGGEPGAAPVSRAPQITLHSAPEGAQVFDAAGTQLGDTPFLVDRPAAGARTALELRREGYEPHPVLLSELSADELTVPLARRERRRRDEATPTSTPEVHVERPRPERGATPASPREFLDPWNQR